MLAFVVTIKPRAISRDWGAYSALVNRTLTSLTRQTCDNYRIVAVHSDPPLSAPQHPHLEYVSLDLPLPHNRATKNDDKARRLLAGVRAARRHGPTHFMPVDSDDLVSVRLAGFVRDRPLAPGWFVRSGYIWPAGSGFVLQENRDLSDLCGSTLIVREDLIDLFFSNSSRAYGDQQLEMPAGSIWFDHQRHEMGVRGDLAELPFPGVIYAVLNGENIRADYGLLRNRASTGPLQFARRLARRPPRPITKRLRREFGLGL